MVADIEELVNLDASEIHVRRINAKEVLRPTKMCSSNFQIVDGTTKLFGRDYGVRESTQRREQSGTSKKLGRISTDRNRR